MVDKKVAVYLCRGCDIGDSLDVEALGNVATENGADLCREHECLCGDAGLELIRQDVREGANALVLAEVGFGPQNINPTTEAGWVFYPAAFNAQYDNNDEYQAALTAPEVTAETIYWYTVRFSLDEGLNYTYCDINGAGSNAGYAFDVDAAQGYLDAYMAEAGIDDPADISVNLWFNRGNEDVIEAVAEQWETNLGIDVRVAIMEWAAYLDTLDQCNE